jgi:hypothetical protein
MCLDKPGPPILCDGAFATITPSRGDRNKLLGFTMARLNAPFKITCIEPPKSDDVDLVPRVKHGIEVAKRNGYEFVFIIEDDDYYPLDYFEHFEDFEQFDFVGYSDTTYYNIRTRTWETFEHSGSNRRSSLFTTGFRISALDRFTWPRDNYKWLDIKLWEYANRCDKRIRLLQNNPALGIKGHGHGKFAGKGHLTDLDNKDPDLSYLKSRVDDHAFEFYQTLMNTP